MTTPLDIDDDGTVVEQMRGVAREPQPSALARANEELEAADRAKDEFLAMANHELRAPLASIAGFTRTLLDLEEQLTANQRREFLTIIDRQAERLGRLIEDLMTLSRIQVDRASIFAETTPLTVTIRQLLEDHGRGDVTVMGDDDACAYVDPQHFSQMLLNYVDNAGKYGAAPIHVRVSSDDDSSVQVVVADAGPGVPSELVPRLFDRFARADGAREAGIPGTGLGLSIVRNLARAQGGDAWYEPNEPAGSRFCLRLPTASGD